MTLDHQALFSDIGTGADPEPPALKPASEYATKALAGSSRGKPRHLRLTLAIPRQG